MNQPILVYVNFIGLVVFLPLLIFVTLQINQELSRMNLFLTPDAGRYFSILLIPQIVVTAALLINAVAAFVRYLHRPEESMDVYFSHSYSFAALTVWFFVVVAVFL